MVKKEIEKKGNKEWKQGDWNPFRRERENN